MSFYNEYMKLRQKRLREEEEEKNTAVSRSSSKSTSKTSGKSSNKTVGKKLTDEYLSLREQRLAEDAEEEDFGPVRTRNIDVSTSRSSNVGTSRRDGDDDGKQKWYEGWFSKGAFEDGWQAGDLLRTASATNHDLMSDIYAGASSIVESTIDAGAYVAGGIGGLFGADEFQKKTKDFIKKDLINEDEVGSYIADVNGGGLNRLAAQLILGEDVAQEDYSVLGEKTDSLVQSGGQLLGTIGLQYVGVPWFVTTGVTSFGSGAEAALNEGASYGVAGVSAAITAGADILTEKLFGGSGLGEKGLINLEPLTKGISSKLVKVLADYGVDIAAEGAEEVVAGFASNLGGALYKEENIGDILFSEEAVDEYIQSFIGGAVLGGGMNAGKAIQSAKTGRDYRTGLTETEQKVVDKVYQDTIAQEEAGGKKLTNKEKSKIYDEVMEDFENGAITTDEIEAALGGDTYNSYKEILDSEDSMRQEKATLKKEYDTLNKMKLGDMTGEQTDRKAELKQQLEELQQKLDASVHSQDRAKLKQQLSDEVFTVAKDSRLVESYNEQARRWQVFQADVNQYKGKAKEIIQGVIDKGQANNTRKTREFWDWAAKVGAETNTNFITTTTEEILEMETKKHGKEYVEKAFKGKVPNAYILDDGTIAINVNSMEGRRFLVGHEITHKLEKAAQYGDLQKLLYAYAEGKMGKEAFASRQADVSNRYKNIEGADPTKELTADLVGEYVYGDADFVKHLSTQNQNLFQKIWSEIKHLYKMATAGSQEARDLAKIQRLFEQAYRESGAKNNAKGGKHFSISETTDGRFAAVVDSDILSNIDTTTWDKDTKEKAKKAASDALKRFSDGIVVDGITRKVNKKSRDEYTRSNYTESLYNRSKDVFADKMRAADVADDIVVVATDWKRDGGLNYPRNDNFVDFDHGTTLIVSGDAKYSAEVVVGITDTGDAVFYDVVDMTPADFDIKKEETSTAATTQNAIGDIHEASNGDMIPQSEPEVKRFSLSDAVEETKTLIALHNLTEEKLLKSLELGGLPMPSIAVTKASIPHDNFGNITMIFPKETIDPKASKKNVVYSADAWTPTFPQVEYEADSDVAHRINRKLSELAEKVDDIFKSDLESLKYRHEDNLNHFGGEDGLIQYVMGKYGLKAAYLEEQGRHVDRVTKQVEVDKGFNSANEAKYQAIADILGVSSADEIGKMPFSEAKENHGEALESIYPGMTKSVIRMSGVFKQVMAYLANNDSTPTYKTVTDESAMRQAVDDALDMAGFEAWTREMFSGIVKDKGIYNQKDLFTPSGNRRSFKQTHLPFTLENIVKAMAAQNNGNTKNVAGFNGIKSLRAGTAERFKSIEAMHKREDRLQHLTQEEADKINDDLQDRLFAIIQSIDDENGTKGESNSFIRFDIIGETLMEISESGKYNVADIQQVFSEYGREVSDATAADFKQLLYDVTQMPVNIYEAKPERAVSFDEAGVFVIPRNADVKLKQELLNRGYAIAEYDPDVEGDRQKVVNQFEEYKFSLSDAGETHRYGRGDGAMADTALVTDDVAPVQEAVQETVQEAAPVEAPVVAPTAKQEADDLISAIMDEEFRLQGYEPDAEAYSPATEEEANLEAQRTLKRLKDKDAPPVAEDTRPEQKQTADDPFRRRDWDDRKTKAFVTDNPEAKRFFQEEAERLAADYSFTQPAERGFSDELYYNSGGEKGFWGHSRFAADDIHTLMDVYGLSYAQIDEGLDAIINDTPKVNNKPAKTIEFILNKRMLSGYEMWHSGEYIPPNQEYISWLNEQQHNKIASEDFESLMANADEYAPPEDIAPVMETPVSPVADTLTVEDVMPIAESAEDIAPAYEAIKPKPTKEPRMAKATPAEQARAEILTEEPQVEKKKGKLWSKIKNNVIDKGTVFETLSLKTGNRELQARWHMRRNAEAKAQRYMEKELKPLIEKVEKSGKTKSFYEYLYHMHNVDRMTLAERYGVENKPVFGEAVTADVSREAAAKLEKATPEFKQWAEDIYAYNRQNREMLVEGNIISREVADLWEEMYSHYVPIRRAGDFGINVNVPLDTGRTGVNAPIKRAKGGSQDILPLFDTMGQRTLQTYKAIANNRFGVELKNTLGTTIDSGEVTVDEAIDSVDTQDGLLQEGKNGRKPTFTVFENGEKVTFEITDEMYDAMKPTSEGMAATIKPLNAISNFRRNVITQYNPWFLLKNAVKDAQDVFINSQHPMRTYAAIPKAIAQMATNGHYNQEYLDNGGENASLFDNETNTFKEENKVLETIKTITGLNAIAKANDIIERLPRLAEYIASREAGRSVDVSMLDAARVTTNFAAGGDLTKLLNRNGFTFLNASVQGAVQQVRNVREAKYAGLKGVIGLAAKTLAVGLPALILNHLMWDDDEEYEELSDYVKQNYYIVGKYGDGNFVRIPKGRMVSVIQYGFKQMENMVTGNDEVDFKTFMDLVANNIAPSNPAENNILAPVMDVLQNKTWYGEDLVPTRLQDVPAAEQYDESTDAISRWLGEATNTSPYKWNYLLDQYSGVVGDTFLPMLTPEAETGDNTFAGNMIAPLKDMFTTDSVMNNQNVSDFYDTVDELTVNANSSNATDEDVLKSKYINSVSADIGKLYGQKREIQNSDLPDDEKYEQVREIQRQIDEMAEDSLNEYSGVNITGKYATVGDRHYRWYEPGEDSETEPGWQKISDKQLEKQNAVTSNLGISAADYWSNKEEYDYAYDNPEKYAVAKAVGGYKAFRGYSGELYDIKADKDSEGKSITGSRKEKVLDYINNLDADYGEKIILFKSEYNADDTYNLAIIEYLNSRNDISYEEMETILKELGFTVHADGRVTW